MGGMKDEGTPLVLPGLLLRSAAEGVEKRMAVSVRAKLGCTVGLCRYQIVIFWGQNRVLSWS